MTTPAELAAALALRCDVAALGGPGCLRAILQEKRQARELEKLREDLGGAADGMAVQDGWIGRLEAALRSAAVNMENAATAIDAIAWPAGPLTTAARCLAAGLRDGAADALKEIRDREEIG